MEERIKDQIAEKERRVASAKKSLEGSKLLRDDLKLQRETALTNAKKSKAAIERTISKIDDVSKSVQTTTALAPLESQLKAALETLVSEMNGEHEKEADAYDYTEVSNRLAELGTD